VEPVNLFKLASQHGAWLSLRQATVAGNVANAQTPGYKAREVTEFETVLDKKFVELETTHPGHLVGPSGERLQLELYRDGTWETSHSGNSVRLEEELMKAAETSRGMQLNTSVVQAFHRMLAHTVRG
jgi:flagellar basal-body rod protein FlgB